MPEFFFFPTNGADVSAYAEAYLERFQPRRRGEEGAVLTALPPLRDAAALLARLEPGERSAAVRYLAQHRKAYASRAAEMMPLLPGETAGEAEFVALDGPWRDNDRGTIGCVRRSNRGGLLALFTEWSVDESGRVSHAPAVPTPVRHAVAASNSGGVWVAKHAVDVILEILNYVGQGLAMTGMPGPGLVLSFVSNLMQEVLDEALSQTDQTLEEIGTMLEANKISLELDLARSETGTWSDFMEDHYKDAWLSQVMQDDPTTAEYKKKLEKLKEFVKKVTCDFDSTPRLFDAVHLMQQLPPEAGPDVDEASEAMFKASGFMFLANFVLTLGRQAFNAQLTMEGPDAATKVAEQVANQSARYTAYAQAVKAVVDQQVEKRVALIGFGRPEGGRVEIVDHVVYNPRWGHDYDVDYAWYKNCCGGDDCTQAYHEAETVLPQQQARARVEYRQYLCSKFWSADGGSFDDAVAKMVDNDKKLQALVTQAGGQP